MDLCATYKSTHSRYDSSFSTVYFIARQGKVTLEDCYYSSTDCLIGVNNNSLFPYRDSIHKCNISNSTCQQYTVPCVHFLSDASNVSPDRLYYLFFLLCDYDIIGSKVFSLLLFTEQTHYMLSYSKGHRKISIENTT